jgi:SAM-dependent methyltransferase
MMDVARVCPLCGSGRANAVPFLEGNIDKRKIDGSSFASRKTPEYMSHAMLRCLSCDLAYVERPPSEAVLAASYHAADFDSAGEAEDAADTYARVISPVLERLSGRRDSALEIGTGTGAFLSRLADAGFTKLVGVEPSEAAIAAAPPERRGWIREGIFIEKDYAPESFDLICCFMTLEHVRDPGELASSAWRLLRPGGAFVAVTHNYRGLVNRMLGRRSPIVDIEHMQLFSKRSSQRLLSSRRYVEVVAHSFRNAYPLSYWMRLAPIPNRCKSGLIRGLEASSFDRSKLSVNVGNIMSWGFRP